MAGLRGPGSSKDAQLLDERAVFPETVDVNIRQLDPIPAPRYFLKELPLTNEMSDLVLLLDIQTGSFLLQCLLQVAVSGFDQLLAAQDLRRNGRHLDGSRST